MTMYYDTLSRGSVLNGNHYNYKIEKVLGQGTFGITYLAKVSLQGQLGQLDSNVYVTIKEFFMKEINGREGTSVTASSTGKGGLFYDYKQKFAREAKNLSKLKHPNIVNVMDYFEANNTCYYVMEYLSGGDLDTLIEKRGGLSEEETIRFTRQIGAALSFMHQNKMLHLDLKPKNVMINATGDAILIDFGLSKQYDSTGEPESSTTVGRGTPGYAPLEQANYQDGHGFPVTMDVYALGATMYKMLTGVRVPEASVILNEGFPEKALQSHGVSEEIVAVVKKAMSPLKKDRYQQVKDLIDGLNDEDYEHTKIDIPIHIDSHTTSVRISYHDGSIPDAIGYVFLVSRNGKCDFTIKDWKGNTSSIQVDNFNWTQFEQLFNLQKLKYEQNTEESFKGLKGGSFTTIELYNGKSVTVRAEQQTGGISNAGNLVGNVNPLHKYICSIPAVNSLIAKTRNGYVVEPEPTPAPQPQPSPQSKPASEPESKLPMFLIWFIGIVSAAIIISVAIWQPWSKEQSISGTINGHDYVDLGLSVKWATKNVGASSPSDYGGYYAWGETETKSRYDWDNCFDCLDGNWDGRWGTYKIGGKTSISPTSGHDTARENWGGTWRMPTEAEFKELCEKCDWTWTSQGGHNGYMVTGPNGKSIFLPAAGWRYGTDSYGEGELGDFWSSSLSSSYSYDARILYFDSSNHYTGNYDRSYGQSVRPVTD